MIHGYFTISCYICTINLLFKITDLSLLDIEIQVLVENNKNRACHVWNNIEV